MASNKRLPSVTAKLRGTLSRHVKFKHSVIRLRGIPSHHYDVAVSGPRRSLAVGVSVLASRTSDSPRDEDTAASGA